MSLDLYGKKVEPGSKLEQHRFAQVWETRVVELPEDFEQEYHEYCKEYELEEDEDSLEAFISESIDEWSDEEWDASNRETLDSGWDFL